ncbi:MAG: sigma-70 family RNA polymerase sigma factor [Paludisphaera borealis]|uniref:sigma-70 family RNA polymerase sigma factor n=1 Tax=Paludisphaera borealis TaxID=1387353 RepID=UPI00284E4D79|nr:sigma-70 family RNA polymerase sigma factor [Paludisphaera borealis]MDR3620810.1 sigma-70 family RNA polymerase sigma factor [Paludisphaera borealis]
MTKERHISVLEDEALGECRSGTKSWSSLEEQRSFLKLAASRMLHFKTDAGVEASDVVHDAFIEANRCAPSYRGSGEPEWRAWLLKVLRTRVSRLRRQARRRVVPVEDCQGLTPADCGPSPSAAAIGRERARTLSQALLWLEPKDRELLGLKYEGGLDFDSIAASMGLPSAEAARKRHLRAVKRLRIILGPA